MSDPFRSWIQKVKSEWKLALKYRKDRFILNPYRWLRRTVTSADGFTWHMRGTPDASMPLSHEEWLEPILPLKDGLFVDVGAHVGSWSVRCSKRFNKVVAFEPVPETREILEKNLSLNHCHNVTIMPYALGSSDSYHSMNVEGFLGHSSILPRKRPKRAIQVPIRKLDDFGLSPDFLKIDVEGFEREVAEGGMETMRRARRIMIEVHDRKELSYFEKLLSSFGMITRVVSLGVRQGQTHLIGEK